MTDFLTCFIPLLPLPCPSPAPPLSSSLLYVQVIARGRLLSHQSVDSTDSSAAVEVVVSAQHAPRFQVVCYIAQEDGEIVGDVLEIETVCSLEHKVSGT